MSRVLRTAAVPSAFALACVVGFAVAYRLVGVERHFEVAGDQLGRPWFTSFYISVMAQSNAMGDATPKTVTGRSLFAAQVLAGWLYFLVIAGVVSAYM